MRTAMGICGLKPSWRRDWPGGGLIVGMFDKPLTTDGVPTGASSHRLAVTAVSCGGVVIFKGKVLLLYKNQNGKYTGWVMPRGTLEPDETHKQAALREVKEEAGVTARVIKYIGKTQYTFQGAADMVNKTVHWYLMTTDSFYCKPQAEEFFADAGFYKQHEAYHLLKFHDEKQIMRRAFAEYGELRRSKDWSGNNKLFFKSGLR